jgi:phosphoribosylformimino-5-aminoimidazole carboxamide ribotide isomerase
MKVRPAIDLRDGACVQLVGGDYNNEAVRIADPVAVAQSWRSKGFDALHVVDLDAATGAGNNDPVVDALLKSGGDIQVGGGVRSTDDVERLLGAGASRVVVGTRAIQDPDWLHEIATRLPDKVVLAADVRNRDVVTHGWSVTTNIGIFELLSRLSKLPLAGVLLTAVHLEGQLQGTDTELFAEATESTSCPITASGGITSIDDLVALRDAGVAEVVIGMALYTNSLDIELLTKEFT